MTRPPDLRDLIGNEGTPEEIARLERVHELLLAAGPPAERPGLEPPAVRGRTARLSRRRRVQAALAFAAALVFGAFAVGYLVADRGERFEAARVVEMEGLAPLPDASAELRIGERDKEGNLPLEMHVRGLRPLPEGGWYELYLSKRGKPVLSCGTFRAGASPATARLTVGYELEPWGERYDGWVVTAHLPGRPKAADRVLLTT